MQYTRHPADGTAITVADLRDFLGELDAAGVPDTAVLRAAGVIEVDFVHGPRIARLTADPDFEPGEAPANPLAAFDPANWNRKQRRAAGYRGRND